MVNMLCFLFLGTFGWGISLYLIKILLVSFSPTDIVFYRMAIGALTLIFLAFALRLKTNNIKGLIIDGIVVGTFNMSIPFYLTTFAEKNVSSSLASIINGLTPLFTLILGVVFFSSRQKISFTNILSIVLGFLGIVIINSDFNFTKGSSIDFIALIVTTISYGITTNYFKYYARTKDPILVSASAAIVSAMSMLIFKFLTEPLLSWSLPMDAKQIASLLWLGVIGSGICLYLYCFLIKNSGAVFASMITYLMAVTGILAGVLLLDESVSAMVGLGCILILVSIILINHSDQLNKLAKRINKLYLTRNLSEQVNDVAK